MDGKKCSPHSSACQQVERYPSYYPRVGFRKCADFSVKPPTGEKASDSFMAYPLYDGSLDGISGTYYIDSVYFSLAYEDALEYDKKFPPKELHVPVSIDAVLNQLSPVSQSSIRGLNLKTLHALTTKSERELRILNGIDDIAIETIRKVLKDNGKFW